MKLVVVLIIMILSNVLYCKEDENMESQKKLEWHRLFSSELFNSTWSLLDMKTRTPDEDAMMINMAHASLYHWKMCGNAENEYIGEWQVSRVYAVLNMPESSLYHAKRSLDICVKNSFTGFNLAYSYEAIARACMLKKNSEEMKMYLDLAKKESESIKDEESLKMLIDDLNTIQ